MPCARIGRFSVRIRHAGRLGGRNLGIARPISEMLAAGTAMNQAGAFYIIGNVRVDCTALFAIQFMIKAFH